MDFIVTSREEIEKGIIVRTPYIVVSISNSDSAPRGVKKVERTF